ncbi:hypothetical protein CDL60_11560 [Roseateles noduli]|nr:hypothetical protein CDL60_11560 [Roseateles noduli]
MLHQTFQTYVDNRQDLAGLIAYGLYKADKLEFMKTHPDRDVHGFVLGMNLPSQVEAYRTEAMSMLEEMAEESLSDALVDAQAEHLQQLKQVTRSQGFWSGVWSNVLANLIAAAVSILLAVLVFGSKLNFWVNLLKYLGE